MARAKRIVDGDKARKLRNPMLVINNKEIRNEVGYKLVVDIKTNSVRQEFTKGEVKEKREKKPKVDNSMHIPENTTSELVAFLKRTRGY